MEEEGEHKFCTVVPADRVGVEFSDFKTLDDVSFKEGELYRGVVDRILDFLCTAVGTAGFGEYFSEFKTFDDVSFTEGEEE